MSLDPMQRDIVRVAMELPRTGSLALAGGGAMLAHGFIDRVTHDVDLFTPEADDVRPLAQALRDALIAHGYDVSVVREFETFVQLAVTNVDGQRTHVDIARDSFVHQPVVLEIGRVIAPDEVAANKTLALFGRAEARDLVDVDALSRRYSHETLLALARRSDPGFGERYFADALDRASGWPDTEFREIGVTGDALRQLRERATAWARQLRAAPDA